VYSDGQRIFLNDLINKDFFITTRKEGNPMQIRLLKCAGIVLLMLPFFFSDASTVSAAKKFRISFDDYHRYTGTTNYIKAVAKGIPKYHQVG
jgi:hypothetical protein